ncbi:hypothetical protein SAMN05444166_7316 [Singulisphaera sp. GP187]|uniref:hypothetical protein n=1 Tax=Singulisphaera sp. GP187 TaxID=1882752 RepID=UPI00092BEC6E|nr:hypothetical protein [Singulisphaera sp. GP187]SIO63336.1 hypothetical protein SAMN05444166_7316 [Singulisphaera sp. GP187]
MSRRRIRVIEKRRRRVKDDHRTQCQRRHNFDRVLGLMGLHEMRSKFGEKFTSILSRLFPKPIVVPDPTLASDEDVSSKAKELGRDLEKVSIRIGRDSLSHADFFTVCVGLYHLIRCWEWSSPTLDERREWGRTRGLLMLFVQRHEPELITELHETIQRFLAFNSRLDGPIYTVRHQADPEGGRFTCTTTVGRTKPEALSIESGGIRRRAFRCGSMENYDTGEITWISWDGQVLGLDTSSQFPVYIQSHAITQAYRRLGVVASDRSLHYLLVKALRHPQVTPGRDGHLLVDVRLGEYLVGYLVAERIADKVLVKTFLLITMRGTPEGEKLHRRLRMSRADLEYLELDNFAKLAFTDLLKDDVIAEIFRECGFEGLLALAHSEHPFKICGGIANQFKTYFGRPLTSPVDDSWRVPHPGSGQPYQP